MDDESSASPSSSSAFFESKQAPNSGVRAVRGQRNKSQRSDHMKDSSRRPAGLFPAPRSFQHADTPQVNDSDENIAPPNGIPGNRVHPPSSFPEGFDVPRTGSTNGQPNKNPNSQRAQEHETPLDRNKTTFGASQARGLAGSAIDKGIRLAQRINHSNSKPRFVITLLSSRAERLTGFMLNMCSSEPSEEHEVEDVYLAVMGVTGAGKSSFIKLCTNQNVLIGHNLKSCVFHNRNHFLN